MYQALYRQYRPKIFDDVLSQEHITNTIKNQIMSDNIGHAYLFSGTRGTGKTSTAKIFSRAVNCLNPKNGNPCNECEICRGIMDESIMDVIEMDAASNRKIDDIRELIEKVIYPPSRARYKVYIIDEVHMLTTPAFNALLKTLEEPPKHLIFILATTEAEKLPQTILSRCQRYDFKRISIRDITNNMRKICNEREIRIDEKVLNLIARNSDGAMRDALSLLDQCISFTDDEITYDEAIEVLGIASGTSIFKIVDGLVEENLSEVLGELDEVIQNGKDIGQFIRDLINHFRNLMVCKTSKNPVEILEIDEDSLADYQGQASRFKLDYLIRAMDRLTEAEIKSKRTSHPRIVLETALVGLAYIDNLDLEERILRLENYLRDGKHNNIIHKLPVQKSVRDERPEVRLEKIEENQKLLEEKREDKQSLIEEVEEKVSLEEVDKVEKVVFENTNLSLEKVKAEWDNIMKGIKTKKISVYAYLMEGKLLEFKNNMITIGYEEGYAFHKEAVSTADNKKFTEEIFSNVLQADIKLDFIMLDERRNSDIDKKKDENNEEILEEVINFFGKDIVEIKED